MSWLDVLVSVSSALFAAGGAYAAVRVELRWLRHDIDRIEARVTRIEGAALRAVRLRGE